MSRTVGNNRSNLVELPDPTLCTELPGEIVNILTKPMVYPKDKASQTLLAEKVCIRINKGQNQRRYCSDERDNSAVPSTTCGSGLSKILDSGYFRDGVRFPESRDPTVFYFQRAALVADPLLQSVCFLNSLTAFRRRVRIRS
jgi:hypothetical protein